LGHQRLGCEESHLSALHTAGKAQGAGQMRLARPTIAHQQHIFLTVGILADHEFPNQFLFDGRLSLEVEGVQRLDDGEAGVFDPPFSSAFLAVQSFSLYQTQQEADVITIAAW
jgi:hypothetical protein